MKKAVIVMLFTILAFSSWEMGKATPISHAGVALSGPPPKCNPDTEPNCLPPAQ